MKTIEKRFWEKVDKTDTCWLWIGYVSRNGYGQFTISGKHYYAHRVAYELETGPIPEGLQIDHLCRVRSCVNPSHLEPVTARENTLRGEGPAAKEALRTHCPYGHEYAGENLYFTPKGYRQCKKCNARRKRLSYSKGGDVIRLHDQ